MKNALVIRADASPAIGIGHLMRMIALAQAWQDVGGQVILVTGGAGNPLIARCRAEGMHVRELAAGAPDHRDQDLAVTLETAREAAAEWLVIDHYQLDRSYQETVRQAGFRLLVIDDYAHWHDYSADLLLNQNYGAEAIRYRIPSTCRLLTGCRYALLRREFRRDPAPPRDPAAPVEHLLITFGGADPDNVTLTAMKAVESCRLTNLAVTVLVGAANRHRESLAEFARTARTPFHLLENVGDMPSLLRRVDLAVTAGGSTCWELARYGIIMVIVTIAENQQSLSRALNDDGLALLAGAQDDISADRLAAVLKELLAERRKSAQLSSRAAALIDARGALRTVGRMIAPGLSFRRAEPADTMKLLEWRNADEVRKHSLNPERIDEAGHRRWMEKVLADPERDLLIAGHGEFEIGVVRFDGQGESAVISVYLNPVWIGSGLGREVIGGAVARVFAARERLQTVTAEILEKNPASQKAFAAAGFFRTGDRTWQLNRNGVRNVQ